MEWKEILKSVVINKEDLRYNIEKIKEFVIKAIGDYHSNGISIVKTGKSCAIRKLVPIVDFSRLFDEQELFVKESFEAVHELAQLYNKLDLLGIYNALKWKGINLWKRKFIQ